MLAICGPPSCVHEGKIVRPTDFADFRDVMASVIASRVTRFFKTAESTALVIVYNRFGQRPMILIIIMYTYISIP